MLLTAERPRALRDVRDGAPGSRGVGDEVAEVRGVQRDAWPRTPLHAWTSGKLVSATTWTKQKCEPMAVPL